METNGGNSRSWRCVLYLRPALCGVFLGRTNSFLTGDGGNSLSSSSVSTSTTSTLLGSPLSSLLLANIFISYLLRPYTRLYFLNSPYRNGICLSTMMNGRVFFVCLLLERYIFVSIRALIKRLFVNCNGEGTEVNIILFFSCRKCRSNNLFLIKIISY